LLHEIVYDSREQGQPITPQFSFRDPGEETGGAHGIVKANRSSKSAKKTTLTTLRAAASDFELELDDDEVERSLAGLAEEEAILAGRSRLRESQAVVREAGTSRKNEVECEGSNEQKRNISQVRRVLFY